MPLASSTKNPSYWIRFDSYSVSIYSLCMSAIRSLSIVQDSRFMVSRCIHTFELTLWSKRGIPIRNTIYSKYSVWNFESSGWWNNWCKITYLDTQIYACKYGHRIANTYEGSTPTTHTQATFDNIYPVVELRDAWLKRIIKAKKAWTRQQNRRAEVRTQASYAQ